MSRSINRRMAALSALMMALAILWSAVAPDDAEAKRKVQCPTEGNSTECVGTSASENLIGRDATYDNIKGGEGEDTYDGKGGCDALHDASSTSSDKYRSPSKTFVTSG
jgi:hypothetical protein